MSSAIRFWIRAAILGWLLCAAIIVLSAPQTAYAGGGCTSTYTVQPGDTLGAISRRLDIPLAELVRENRGRIWNPDLIFVGQELCLPERSGQYKFVLEAGFTVKSTPEEGILKKIAGNGRLGKRVEYPLESIGGIEAYSETIPLLTALAVSPPPVLIGVRNDPSGAEDYTLVAIGRSDILTSLMISDTITITPSTGSPARRPVSEILRSPFIERSSVTLWLETDEGLRRPYVVTHLDLVRDYRSFAALYTGPMKPEEKCRDECVDFALFPAASGHYRAVLRLASAVNGPVEYGKTARCGSWLGRRGLWYWFLRRVNRCGR